MPRVDNPCLQHVGLIVAVEDKNLARPAHALAVETQENRSHQPRLCAVRAEQIAKAGHQRIEWHIARQPRGDAAIDDRLLRVGQDQVGLFFRDQPDIPQKSLQILQRLHAGPVHRHCREADFMLGQPVRHEGIFVGRNGKDIMSAFSHAVQQGTPEIDERIGKTRKNKDFHVCSFLIISAVLVATLGKICANAAVQLLGGMGDPRPLCNSVIGSHPFVPNGG